MDTSWENARRLKITNACSSIKERLRDLLSLWEQGRPTNGRRRPATLADLIGDGLRGAMEYLCDKRNKICHAACENPSAFTDEEIVEKVETVKRALLSAETIQKRMTKSKIPSDAEVRKKEGKKSSGARPKASSTGSVSKRQRATAQTWW